MAVETQYNLYATYAKISDKELKEKYEYSLRPCGRRYTLVFTKKKLQAPFVLIPEGTPLQPNENEWLLPAKMEVWKKYLEENPELVDFAENFFNKFSEELEIEKEKLKNDKATKKND